MTSPSLTLTVWAGSWLSGHTSPDDVIDALHVWAPMHLISAADPIVAVRTGLPDAGVVDGAAVVLATIRRADPAGAAGLRLVLPAPGDVRGLPAGTAFAAAALAAGEGVLVGAPGAPGIGLVPAVEGPDVLRWNVFGLDEIPAEQGEPGLGEVEYSLREAVRTAADSLAGVQTVGGSEDPRVEIAALTAAAARHTVPPTVSPRVGRILDTADQVASILTVAGHDGGLRPGSASGAAAREAALRPLWDAVRTARRAAVTAVARHSPQI